MEWLYNNNTINNINDLPIDTFGFVYIITNTISGKQYVGKKQILSNTRVPLTNNDINTWKETINKGKCPKKKLVSKESKWKDYYGSSTELKQDIKIIGKDKFKREIIHICFSKRDLTYYETKYLFTYSVLESNMFYNKNILCKFYK